MVDWDKIRAVQLCTMQFDLGRLAMYLLELRICDRILLLVTWSLTKHWYQSIGIRSCRAGAWLRKQSNIAFVCQAASYVELVHYV
jgi:hypothetical protein